MYAIEVKNLNKRFPNNPADVISHLSFALPEGDCLCLLGPSGCGKTTLLRLLMGLVLPTGGEIHIAPALRTQMGYMFQEPRLIPWRTALENVLLPIEIARRRSGAKAMRPRAIELLDSLGLKDQLGHFPNELSGGMQMRVSLARALITEPKILMFDEPFAALDERNRFRLQDLLLTLKRTLSLQYVFVTHSISEAVYLGDYILLMDNHGNARDFRRLDFDMRTQDLKTSAAFNSRVEYYAQQFVDLESGV